MIYSIGLHILVVAAYGFHSKQKLFRRYRIVDDIQCYGIGSFSFEYQRNHNLFCFVLAAIATVVTIAEILKNNGLAFEKSTVPYAFLIILFPFWCMLMLF